MTAAPLIAATAATQPQQRNIIAVAAGTPGIGKTWFAITLAHALARAGRKALLFDGDLGLGNVEAQLALPARRDLGSVIAGAATLQQAAVRCESGFDVVAGKAGSGSLASVAASRLMLLRSDLQRLAQNYDWVVLDLGPGIERMVPLLSSRTRACLVLTTDEPTAITDAYAYIKAAAPERLAEGIRIVVNMVSSRRDGERTYGTLLRACREFLKLEPPLAGIVRRDPRVPDSIRRRTSLLSHHPAADAAKDVEAIAGELDRNLPRA